MSKASSSSSGRLVTFDLLRGYFLLSILLNHLDWYPNLLDFIAARGQLFVSAAEGFFLISGIILGIVRGRKLLDAPFKKAAFLLIKRGVMLYGLSIGLMLLFTFLGWGFFMDNPGLKPGIRPIDEPLMQVIFGAFSFEYIYGWADYLRLYAIFLIISPIPLWLLRKGKWYLLGVLSIGVWSLYSLADPSTSGELLMPISWQLIFFAGMTIGFYWRELTGWWLDESRRNKTRKVEYGIIAVAVVTILLNLFIVYGQAIHGAVGETAVHLWSTLAPMFSKEALPPARLFLFGLWFWFGYLVVKRYQTIITKWFGWLILTFGRQSLYTYVVHAFVVFFAHLIMFRPTDSIIVNFIGSVLVVAAVWLIIYTTPRSLTRIKRTT